MNGQPRTILVLDRAASATIEPHRKADPADENHVGAPMPGLVVGVSVTAGQDVRAGDGLVAIEAMKMETLVRAERDGRIEEVAVVASGTQVDAHDLLVVDGPKG